MASREEMLRELKRRDMIAQLQAREFGGVSPDIVQEQSPGVSAVDRLLVKNLAANPEAAAQYIRQKNPGAEVENYNGQTIVKLPGEAQFRVVDPDTGFFSSDFLADTGDIVGDVVQGGLAGLATTAGGVAGGFPGATAAGAVSGGGLELARQGLGTLAGIPQNFDPVEVQTQGALNAFAGGGEKVAAAGYRALRDKLGPVMAQTMSGVPKEVWKDFRQNMGRVTDWGKNPEKLTSAVQDLQQEVVGITDAARQKVGGEIGKAIEQSSAEGTLVDISPLKKELGKRITKAESLAARSGSAKSAELPEDLRSLGEYFGSTQVDPTTGVAATIPTPNLVSPDVAMQLKQQLRELTQPKVGAVSKLKNPADKEITSFANTASDKLTDEMVKAMPRLGELNKQYSSSIQALDQVSSGFKDLQTSSNTIKNMDRGTRDMLKSRLETIAGPKKAAELREKMQALQTQSYLGDPASSALSGLGTTSTSRTVPAAGVGTLMGMALGSKLGGGGYVPTAIGGAVGGVAGAKAGSPATIAKGYRLLNKLESVPVPSRPVIYGLGQSAWEGLNE